jgi:hypothetical protein
LAIVKQIVELHGGTVQASSAGPGMGATFLVQIPTTPLAANASPAADKPANSFPAAARRAHERPQSTTAS